MPLEQGRKRGSGGGRGRARGRHPETLPPPPPRLPALLRRVRRRQRTQLGHPSRVQAKQGGAGGEADVKTSFGRRAAEARALAAGQDEDGDAAGGGGGEAGGGPGGAGRRRRVVEVGHRGPGRARAAPRGRCVVSSGDRGRVRGGEGGQVDRLERRGGREEGQGRPAARAAFHAALHTHLHVGHQGGAAGGVELGPAAEDVCLARGGDRGEQGGGRGGAGFITRAHRDGGGRRGELGRRARTAQAPVSAGGERGGPERKRGSV